jgi:hypothetical protein
VSVILVWLMEGHHAQAQEFTATHYGYGYNGSPMGCYPYAPYNSSDTTIAAVGYPYTAQWPCGATVELEGVDGRRLTVIRQDTCPGCGAGMIDLSEAGLIQVCGSLGGCTVRVVK